MEKIKAERCINISMRWISTKENIVADALSRGVIPPLLKKKGTFICPFERFFPWLVEAGRNTWKMVGHPKIRIRSKERFATFVKKRNL